MESRWRGNIFDLNFDDQLFTLCARVVSGTFEGRYISDLADVFGGVLIWIASPATLPVVMTTGPKFADNFPYGYDVEPD